MSNSEIDRVRFLYECFNKGDFDAVFAAMAEDVLWANAAEGGHERGRDNVRSYWQRLSRKVVARDEPIDFSQPESGVVTVTVAQSLMSPQGHPIDSGGGGLQCKTLLHRFKLVDNQIVRFDVEDLPPKTSQRR